MTQSRHLPIRAYNKKHIDKIVIVVYVCDICNYSCWYCYNAKPRTQQYINLARLYDFLEFIHGKLQKDIIVELIGGEPTLHPHIIDFCSKCHHCNYIDVITYSNFSLNVAFYNKLILDYDVKLLLSYHHSECNRDDFMLKLSQIVDKTSIYDLNVIADPTKFNDCIEVFDHIRNVLNIKTASLTLVKCKSNDKKFVIDNYSLMYSNNQLNISNQKSKNAPTNDILTIEYDDGSIEEIDTADVDQRNINFYLWKCDAGKNFFYIDKTEYIYPCNIDIGNNQKIIGNLSNPSIIKIKQTLCQHKVCYDGINALKTRVFYQKSLNGEN